MRKLIEGIVDFRRNIRPEQRKRFAQLATGQSPDALFIACSDSRVVPNTFASTEPGDLFVFRNVGNLIPPADSQGVGQGDVSEAAAVEYAVKVLGVRNIIICGHSECGAMKALVSGDHKKKDMAPNLARWLQVGEPALEIFKSGRTVDATLTPHNQLSLLNILQQMKHVETYPCVRDAVKAGTLAIHGWYFDIGHADVYAYEKADDIFVLIDETEAGRILAQMK